MKVYTPEFIRNVTFAGHQGAGKTTLVESILYDTGAIGRVGRVEDGSTVSDFDDDERERKISLNISLLPVEFHDHKINILDTPGFTDFQGEVQQAIRVSDAVIILVDAVAGPEVGTELAMQFAHEFNQPVMIVVNKMDRENASFNRTLDLLRERFPGHKFVPVLLPLGEQANFKGILNAVTRKAYLDKGDKPSEVPDEYKQLVEDAHTYVVEAAAEADDEYISKYFETGELTFEEIRDGMRKAARNADLNTIPVFALSSTTNVGVFPFMEALTVYIQPASGRRVAVKKHPDDVDYEFLNPPQSDEGPLVAYVFKSYTDKYGTLSYFRIFSGSLKPNDTVFNPNSGQEERLVQLMTVRGKEQIQLTELHAGDIGVVSKLKATHTGDTLTSKSFGRFVLGPRFLKPVYEVSVHPKSQADSAKLSDVLKMVTDADRTLQWRQDHSTRETVLSGMGGMQIDIAIKRAERLGCHLDTTLPKVPYQETIQTKANADYRHKKQTGGAGQFGEVYVRVEPLDPNSDFVFASEVVGGAISGPFIQSAEKGIRSVLSQGVIAGYPVVGVKAVVYDGKEHPVDSKDVAFQIAGRKAFQEAFRKAKPALLEPYVNAKITVPEENTGDIMSDLTTRRGRVQGMDTMGGQTVIIADVPLAEMQRYSNDLRSMTSGRGVFSMETAHYEVMPSHLADKIMSEYKGAQDDD